MRFEQAGDSPAGCDVEAIRTDRFHGLTRMDDPWRHSSTDRPPPLALGETHVWQIALDAPDSVVTQLRSTLDANEEARAERFRMGSLRTRFIVGRGALRSILGCTLGITPEQVAFEYGTYGKPSIASPNPVGLEFNLAHTQDVALCAVTRDRPIGVDVETIRRLDDSGKIITRYFSTHEQAEYLRLPDNERIFAFYRGWARKEAYLKATGAGISAGLDTFDVTLSPGPPALLRVGNDPEEAPRWSLIDLDVGPGLTAAVVVKGRIERVALWRWDWPV
jgi:4'-phosphopantetheinyl transferase